MSKEATSNSQIAQKHAMTNVKKSILVFLTGGLVMEWLRLKFRDSRRPKPKKD